MPPLSSSPTVGLCLEPMAVLGGWAVSYLQDTPVKCVTPPAVDADRGATAGALLGRPRALQNRHFTTRPLSPNR